MCGERNTSVTLLWSNSYSGSGAIGAINLCIIEWAMEPNLTGIKIYCFIYLFRYGNN